MAALEAEKPPTQVGRYEIVAPIASGGMATVWLARRTGPGGFTQEVALKLTHAHLRDTTDFARVLVEEAKVSSLIVHPNVVRTLDVDDDPAGVFLVMEYIEGASVVELVRARMSEGGRVPLPIAMKIVTDALAGLHAAHELKDPNGRVLGLVHRDFSPHNILVGTDGVARLTDFGIAKVTVTCGLTRTGLVKGKLAYMAPEQVKDEALDRRTDVWAAGVVAWELVTGQRLYDARNDAATILRILSEDPPPVRAFRPDVSAELDDAILSAMIRDREARCPTADELRRRLVAAAGEIADANEVGAFVRGIAGAKLQSRRGTAVTGPHLPTPKSSGTAPMRKADASSSAPAQAASVPSVEPSIAIEISGLRPVESTASPPPKPRSVAGILAAAVGVGALAALVVLVVVAVPRLRRARLPDPPSTSLVATSTAASSAIVRDDPPPPPIASSAPALSVAPPIESAPPPRPKPVATGRVPSKKLPAPPPPPAPTVSSAPKLHDSPYE